ncbi:unnamed protein product [Polarella glacialis]|uniref:Uncharacterized protein n=1 Tax=Polarella glacialis TaxID=89957 RepID=A0A813DJG1_POLGL|nr:unnamed protein product [Polarella glacialis]
MADPGDDTPSRKKASNKMQREAVPFLVPEASSEPKAWLGDVKDSGAPAASGSALAWMSATADQSPPKVVPASNAGKNLQDDKALRLSGTDANQRLIAHLMQNAVNDGKPPMAYLPAEVDAVAEMNGLYWKDKQRGLVEGIFPQMSCLEQLVQAYPQAFFILNTRDHEAWVKSVDNHLDMRQRLVSAELPGLPKGKGGTDQELIEWVAAHHQRVRDLLSARGCRLLCFDIDQHGEAELSSFLGRPLVWPHSNATPAWKCN